MWLYRLARIYSRIMQLSIVLLLAMKLLGVQSRAYQSRHDFDSSEEELFDHGAPSSNNNCICTPFYECYDSETNSNLKNLVDDRSNIPFTATQESEATVCPYTNDVCCYNRVRPSATPTVNSSPLPKPQGPSQIFPQSPTTNQSFQPQSPSPFQTPSVMNANCICTPYYRCYDSETSSNLTDLVDDRINIPIAAIQESQPVVCQEPNDICCYNYVQSSATPTTNSSPQPKPQGFSQVSPQIPTKNLSPQPGSQGPSQISPQTPSMNPTPQLKPQSPSTPNCICTPHYRCYDLEEISNVTSLVDDRINIPITARQESEPAVCLEANDVCCYELVQHSKKSTKNPSPKHQSQVPSQISLGTPMTNPSPQPQPPRPSQISHQISTGNPMTNPSPRPQPPRPSQISHQISEVVQPTYPPRGGTGQEITFPNM